MDEKRDRRADGVMLSRSGKIWECKIGGVCGELPGGADFPMRLAVELAFHQVTREESAFMFSGWGAAINKNEEMCTHTTGVYTVREGRFEVEMRRQIETQKEAMRQVIRNFGDEHQGRLAPIIAIVGND